MQITLVINEVQAGILQGCLKDTGAAVLIEHGRGKLSQEQAQALEIECFTLWSLIEEAKNATAL